MVVMLVFLLPSGSHAQNDGNNKERIIRAGWHEAPYFIMDRYGRRSGYSYEYQQKIAAYTGWKYEYVEGGWSVLLDRLKKGEIDLLANVSYTDERARNFLFSSLPMGTEAYYLFVSPANSTISSDDYSSLNGKTTGVAKGSIQKDLFIKWAEKHNVTPELIELTSTEEESLGLLGGKLDAFVTMDVNIAPNTAVPVWKIGSSDYYFAVSSARPDLLSSLNAAMSRIQDENILYSHQLSEKYFKNAKVNQYLDAGEKRWLAEHGKIRVGYQDNYLAFCARDEVTGKLTGTLKDFLDYASTAFENASVDFEAISYPTASAALEALERGEIDIMFPANLNLSEAESMNISLTPALIKTEMDAVIRNDRLKDFALRDTVTVAVNRGNTNYLVFLNDYFPKWKIKFFENTNEGLEGIASGEADTLIISNYRYNNIARQCEKLNLTTVYSGVDLNYYFAVRRGNTQLYSIMTKATAIVPNSVIHAALTYYSTEDAKTGFIDIVRKNLVTVILGILVIVLLIYMSLSQLFKLHKPSCSLAFFKTI
jgi:ABC-type amino acid transport substrate-binding protein